MRFRLRSYCQPWPAFALVPHCCEDCGVWYWLEWGFRLEVFSQIDGSVSCYRCAGCQRERFAMMR